jgi:pyruvate-ferredoxin/flavodoxin oxidoreductase
MVVWVEAHVAEAACAFPITSSTNMGVEYQRLVANGFKNLWDDPIAFVEAESEHSSASACEGYMLAGGRVTNFTSGQGLILMKEVLYTISGKRLGMVLNVGARALTSQSLNVHAGHDDVMGVTDVGWGMLFAKNAQEAADLCLIARRTAEDTETPFMNIQDGFLTTHTVERVLKPEEEMMKAFIGPSKDKIHNLMDTANPIMSGPVQNQDSYMKGKIAQRYFYDLVPDVLQNAMDEYYALTGRRYEMVEPYKMDDAEYAIVGMGSMSESAMATADYVREHMGIKLGVVNVTAFRPFPGPQMVEALKNVKAFSVLERLDVPMGQSNPLTTEIKASFADAMSGANGYPVIKRVPRVFSGSGGLGSRDIRAGDFVAIAENMIVGNKDAKEYFVVGVEHPMTIKASVDPDISPPNAFAMRGHSVGGYGAVTTLKVIASIVGDVFGFHVQASPKYGSEKKGLPTNTYLTIGSEKVRAHQELREVDFVPLANANAFNLGNPLVGLREGGALFVQTESSTPEGVWEELPLFAKKIVKRRNIRVLGLDNVKIAREEASSPDLVQRMQGIVLLGVFLRTTPYQQTLNVSDERLWEGVTEALRHYFGPRRGEQVVQDNVRIVQRGYREVLEVPRELIEADESLDVEDDDSRADVETTNLFFV